MVPPLLPWLGVFLLLMLRSNREAKAWWIWAPLVCVFAVKFAVQATLASLPSEFLDAFCQVTQAMAFGLAAIWLCSTHLESKVRFLTSLKMFMALGGFGLLAYVTGQDWSEAGGQQYAALLYLGIFALALVTALSLAGFSCRRHFQSARLLIWLIVWLAAAFAVVILPFMLFVLFAGGGDVLVAFGGAVLVSTLVAFAVLLPFLILSFANVLFRERLCRLLRMELQPSPPLLATATPVPAT
jgi:hypothetical protein